MPYKGEIKKLVQYNINVDNSAVTGKTALTILKINRRDKIASAETFTVDAGAQTQIPDTVGDRIDRVIISVHPPTNGNPSVEVAAQASFPHNCQGDTDLAFDTIA